MLVRSVFFSVLLLRSVPVPAASSCDFYLGLERDLGCPRGADYLKNYGHRFCRKFEDRSRRWHPRLQVWTSRTASCLQGSLLTRAKEKGSCEVLVEEAFDLHSKCYAEAGFCGLSYEERQKIIDVVDWPGIRGHFGGSVAQALHLRDLCGMDLLTFLNHTVDWAFAP